MNKTVSRFCINTFYHFRITGVNSNKRLGIVKKCELSIVHNLE